LWVQTRSDVALTVRVHHQRKSVVLCEGRAWKMPDPTDKSASDRARILTEFGKIPRWDICVHLGQLNTVHGFEAIHWGLFAFSWCFSVVMQECVARKYYQIQFLRNGSRSQHSSLVSEYKSCCVVFHSVLRIDLYFSVYKRISAQYISPEGEL
jgi:hypothetical protein